MGPGSQKNGTIWFALHFASRGPVRVLFFTGSRFLLAAAQSRSDLANPPPDQRLHLEAHCSLVPSDHPRLTQNITDVACHGLHFTSTTSKRHTSSQRIGLFVQVVKEERSLRSAADSRAEPPFLKMHPDNSTAYLEHAFIKPLEVQEESSANYFSVRSSGVVWKINVRYVHLGWRKTDMFWLTWTPLRRFDFAHQCPSNISSRTSNLAVNGLTTGTHKEQIYNAKTM